MLATLASYTGRSETGLRRLWTGSHIAKSALPFASFGDLQVLHCVAFLQYEPIQHPEVRTKTSQGKHLCER